MGVQERIWVFSAQSNRMVFYKVSYTNPHRHFISFEVRFDAESGDTFLQLPSWRPGRYELGNFAKNLRAICAFDGEGKSLSIEKTTKDTWKVSCDKAGVIIWKYEYYAAELNAGSSFLDQTQLYINPVNCFFYDVSNPNQPYEIHFELPEDYQIACGLPETKRNILHAENFDHLADCPLIASPSLTHDSYDSNGIKFHIWIQGEIFFNLVDLKKHFIKFTETHFEIFGTIPCEEYHFIFQFPAIAARHGVEHRNSTVVAMGPASGLSQDDKYFELLGISCHELFHTWNVKDIRPKEMKPYDFTSENYSKSGFVYEGVTTYYGDLLLWRSGVFPDKHFLDIMADTIMRHLENEGRFNLSVADSSYDTWLDGYVPGIPWRKVSIYNEGCMIAWICDVLIMKATHSNKSLDDVMIILYNRFGRERGGYSAREYREILEEVSGSSFVALFDNIVLGTSDFIPWINECLEFIDISMKFEKHENMFSADFGLKVSKISEGSLLVQDIMRNSPADMAGIWRNDIITKIQNVSASEFNYKDTGKLKFDFISNGIPRSAEFIPESKSYYDKVTLEENSNSNAFKFWKSRGK
ncbi:MAG: hypothetical protein SGI87_03055 [Flavobacteriales bacterium]|nr:hypothetical protein [Flavobacteriales bacterium]